MKKSTFITWTLIGSLIGTLIAYNKVEPLEDRLNKKNSIVRTINARDYRFVDNKVTELTADNDNVATYGVISDIHGEIAKARAFAGEFKKKGVDGIIIPGDIPKNEQLRYGRRDSKEDKQEIIEALEVIAETGLPIYVIPGNHERKPDYEAALSKVTAKYSNVIDMTKYRIFNGDDVDFVSLSGYQIFRNGNRQFIPNDGYWANPDFIMETGKLREGLDDAVVLITHGAGKTNARVGPATIYNGQDVGDDVTAKMQKENNIPFAVVGHIHEAGGIAATFDGKNIKPGEWARQFTANFGGLEKWQHLDGNIYDGMAGILTVKGDVAKYEMLYLK